MGVNEEKLDLLLEMLKEADVTSEENEAESQTLMELEGVWVEEGGREGGREGGWVGGEGGRGEQDWTGRGSERRICGVRVIWGMRSLCSVSPCYLLPQNNASE